jgi:DNA-binding FadR family transcriptional regulator
MTTDDPKQARDVASRARGSGKLAASVVARIEADIMSRGWRVGEVIGTFAQLIDRYDASRAVIREAVGLLEHKKIVRMKHGPGGGVEVRAPVGAAVVDAIRGFLDFTGVTERERSDLRKVLFGLTARRAAERLDAQGAARLIALIDREDNIATQRDLTIDSYGEFYSLIGSLSRNPALAIFIPAITSMDMEDVVHLEPSPEFHRLACESHRGIAEAILSRDPCAAESKAIEHVTDMSRLIASAAEASDAMALPCEHLPAAAIARDGEGKLPVRVARFIRREILDKGLRPGDVVGFERDLLESFNVSRSVFREAVRVVEYHGLAKMRRGPKGGLTVCDPDPKQMEDTIIAYLEYMGMDLSGLLEVRIAVEVMNVRCAIDAGGAEIDRLGEKIDERHVHDEEQRQLGLHRALSELSGNRASAFVSNVLSALIDAHIGLKRAAQIVGPDEVNAWKLRSQRQHEEIIEAVQRRDHALARERMIDHLEFFSTPLRLIASKS